MSRMRWGLAAAISVVALVAAVQALRTYLNHDLTVGVLAVGGLAFTVVLGMGSLAWARRRIGAELAGLRSSAGSGTLLADRKLRLQAIKAAGARPDPEALAAAAAAEEAGRAYVGRYLVATTVLFGLLGTFAGLMETLGRVSPAVTGAGADGAGLALLVAPLAGLHVTFGASMVAILATLALALAQGDLTLHEEQALAALADRTIHELIPALWPTAEDPAERSLVALGRLEAHLGESVARALGDGVAKIAKAARAESERAAAALDATTATVEKKIDALVTALTAALVEATKANGAVITKAAEAATRATTAAAEASAQRSMKIAEDAAGRTTAATEAAVARVAEATVAAQARAAKLGSETVAQALAAVAAMAERTTVVSTEAITQATAAAARAMEHAGEAAARATTSALEAALAATERSTAAGQAAAARAAAAAEEASTRAASAAEAVATRVTAATEAAVEGTTRRLTEVLDPLFAAEAGRLDGVREAVEAAAARIDGAATRFGELTTAVESGSREQVGAVQRSGDSLMAAFDRVVLGAGASMDQAAGVLAAAAKELRAGTETFGPGISALSHELSGLGRELALLLSRNQEAEVSAVVLAELERLSAGVDRLADLVRLAESGSLASHEAAGGNPTVGEEAQS